MMPSRSRAARLSDSPSPPNHVGGLFIDELVCAWQGVPANPGEGMRIRIENWPEEGDPEMIMVTAFPLETDEERLTYWKQEVERQAKRALTHDVPKAFALDAPIDELVFDDPNESPDDETVRVYMEDLDLWTLHPDLAAAVTGLLIWRLGSYLTPIFPVGTALLVIDRKTGMQRPFTRECASGAAAAR